MDTLRRFGLVLAWVALFGACARSTGGQTGDEDALPSDDSFFAALGSRGGAGNYQPARSVAALVADSERVVVGTAVALRAGRTFVEADGPARGEISARTAVLELAVERTLKGAERPSLYLEFFVGSAELAPPARLPESRLVAFAVQSGEGWLSGTAVEGEGRGLPAGETLHRLTNPDALAIASADGRSVASIERTATVFGGGDLDDLIAMVERALGGTAGDAGVGPGPGDAGVSEPSADAGGGCPGEYPTGPGADPIACPSECEPVQASPLDAANACVDYEVLEALGCVDGGLLGSIDCVERIADGQHFLVRSAWPFRTSTNYRACSDELSRVALAAPDCM
jgi:hypothetical protein